MGAVEAYRAATKIAPDARRDERDRLIAWAQIEAHHAVLDAPAWGGYVSEAIEHPSRIIGVDTPIFAGLFPEQTARGVTMHRGNLDRLPITSSSIDRVVSLVGLHHHEKPDPVLREFYRVLHPGGWLVLAEVLQASPVAWFLNESIHKLKGSHSGTFPTIGSLAVAIDRAGFVETVVTPEPELAWRFASAEQMGAYFAELFQLRATVAEVIAELYRVFEIRRSAAGVAVPWMLGYARGIKPRP